MLPCSRHRSRLRRASLLLLALTAAGCTDPPSSATTHGELALDGGARTADWYTLREGGDGGPLHFQAEGAPGERLAIAGAPWPGILLCAGGAIAIALARR